MKQRILKVAFLIMLCLLINSPAFASDLQIGSTLEIVDLFFIPPGFSARSLAWDGTYIWSRELGEQTICQLNTSGEIIHCFSFESARSGWGLTYDGANLWACSGSNLYEITTNGEILNAINVPTIASIHGVTWDGSNLWITGQESYDQMVKLLKITKTGVILEEYWTGEAGGKGDLTFDGTYLWLSNIEGSTYGSSITKVTTKGEILKLYKIGRDLGGITWDGNYLWFLEEKRSRVYQAREASLEIVNSFPSPSEDPGGLAWDGNYLWYSDSIAPSYYQLSTSGEIIDSFEPWCEINICQGIDSGSSGLTYDGANLWAIGGSIKEINKNGEVLSAFIIDDYSTFGITWDGNNLRISDPFSIYEISTRGEKISEYPIKRIHHPGDHVTGGKLAFDGEHLWLAGDGSIFELGIYGNEALILAVFPLAESLERKKYGITWGDSYLWFADDASDMIYQLQLVSPEITTSSSSTTTVDQNTTTTTIDPITTTIISSTTTTSTPSSPCPMLLVYGEDSEEVELLRYFRDNALSKTQEGQELIRLYYQWSPVIVRMMESDEDFNQEVKELVDEMLSMIE